MSSPLPYTHAPLPADPTPPRITAINATILPKPEPCTNRLAPLLCRDNRTCRQRSRAVRPARTFTAAAARPTQRRTVRTTRPPRRVASAPAAPCPCDHRAPARPLPRQTQTRNLHRFRVCLLALQLVQRRRPDSAPARRRPLDARPPRASQTQQYTTPTQSHGAHKARHLQLRAFVPWCEAQS